MKVVKKILLVLLIALVLLQFYRPDKNTMATIPETDFIVMAQPSESIATLLQTSCYDCHSNNTRYPWYNNIAPISYWLADHIDHGKGHLNFSLWGNYTAKEKAHKLEELIEEVKAHAMPLDSYLWMHSEAKLSEDEIQTLVRWADKLRAKYVLAKQ